MVEILTRLRSSESASACYYEIYHELGIVQTDVCTHPHPYLNRKKVKFGNKKRLSILPWLERGESFQPAHTPSYERDEELETWFNEHKPDYP
jgi:hypothetical protein